MKDEISELIRVISFIILLIFLMFLLIKLVSGSNVSSTNYRGLIVESYGSSNVSSTSFKGFISSRVYATANVSSTNYKGCIGFYCLFQIRGNGTIPPSITEIPTISIILQGRHIITLIGLEDLLECLEIVKIREKIAYIPTEWSLDISKNGIGLDTDNTKLVNILKYIFVLDCDVNTIIKGIRLWWIILIPILYIMFWAVRHITLKRLDKKYKKQEK